MAPETPPDTRDLDKSRERRRGVQQACADLEQALARPPNPNVEGWSASVAGAVGEVAEAFSRHVEHSESPEGLLPGITNTAPRLAHAVEDLRRDHEEILAQTDLVRALAARAHDPAQVQAVRDESLKLLQSIAAHRYKGADLVYDAYMVDIEAAD
jgi:hypothetical protein